MAAFPTMKVFILASILTFVFCDIEKRDLKTWSWPDCEKYNETICNEAKQNGSIVIYVKASSESNDNLHYVFSTIGGPSVVVLRTTNVNANLTFNWEKLLQYNNSLIDGAITFSDPQPNIEYKFAVVFTRLLEYDDTDDSADLDYCEKHLNLTSWNIRDFSMFHWSSDDLKVNASTNTFVFNSTSDVMIKTNETRNGSISFAFSVKHDNGRASDLPRMLYIANETMFDFVIANYTPSFNNSRFALEVVVVSLSNEAASADMSVDLTKSIDDEYTPGVFEIIDWLTNPKQSHISGFFQWKPVSYISLPRGRNTATKVEHSDLKNVDKSSSSAKLLNNTVLLAVFNESLWNGKTVKRMANISFGLPKDGFYIKNNYTAWTAAIGYGTPPADSISITVIITISAGLGLPVLIIIVGGIYSIIRKMRKRSSGYEPINAGSINRNYTQSD
ncbi:glycosylated lysosomal membrane protein A-like isoform X2 [Biomphalaria glabrata]|uniref:Glycosylated lysosomal membrane protein A-like isoform X2 n=1 Tax=Biomphalaria glabrata TaxID=6526 RepID=A0A9W2ZSC4_BIOGL|nr:glycosylated lysosomal membrane protein A-like isoform X2 [Biomphalaria glabrata]